jgi:hypothetical protein
MKQNNSKYESFEYDMKINNIKNVTMTKITLTKKYLNEEQ